MRGGLIFLTIVLGGCGWEPPRYEPAALAIAGASPNEAMLTLKLESQFSSRMLLPHFKGPTLAVLNYRTMSPATALPHADDATVLAYAFVSPQKVDGYQSDFMDQPLLEHFEWYKNSGGRRYDLSYRTYQVVEVEGYARSELYLKDQQYHDFFVHCGLHAVPSEDLCTMGKAVQVKPVGMPDSAPVVVNIFIKHSKSAVADWRTIEAKVTRFMLDRISVVPAAVTIPAATTRG